MYSAETERETSVGYNNNNKPCGGTRRVTNRTNADDSVEVAGRNATGYAETKITGLHTFKREIKRQTGTRVHALLIKRNVEVHVN